MAGAGDHDVFPDAAAREDESIISTRGLEAFGRKVTTTASHLMGPLADPTTSQTYQNAMTEVQKQLRRPHLQRSMFSMARTTPTDLVRSRLSATEIEKRALSHVSEEMLRSIPKEDTTSYSLFQGFQATFPDLDEAKSQSAAAANGHPARHSRHRRRPSRGRKLLEDRTASDGDPHSVQRLRKEKAAMTHDLEMLGIRKNMASSEIREIDNKMANLNGMRKILLDRLANLENEEALMEHEIVEVETRLEQAHELADDESLAINTPPKSDNDEDEDDMDKQGFMSQSVYEKIPSSNASTTSSRGRKPRTTRKKSMPILHEHFQPGTMIRAMRAHQDPLTALDFDAPFGMMVSAALDDRVRVWDLNAGRCIGMLEGHTASVRALQMEDNILATGSRDATIRLWDLNKARYDPSGSHFSRETGEGDDDDDEAAMAFENPDDHAVDPPAGTMADCPIFTLEAHVDEITALHFRGDVLVSGSADKTLRQWDLEKGRCVQTLDVMWAAAQASALSSDAADDVSGGRWRQTGPSGARAAPSSTSNNTTTTTSTSTTNHSAAADFVGSLQVFESALACGTADGMVRLWDLRSGQVHRSLVGHTGPVTCLQFDDVHLVTGSLDRSVRIWDLRMGSIFDAYAYDHPITSMMFDARRIVCAAGENVVKVYDKVEGRHWDCGAGAADDAGAKSPSIVERVRIKDGYLLEGRRDGVVGAWTC